MSVQFVKLTEPSALIAEAMNRWENNPELVPLIRPNRNHRELKQQYKVSKRELIRRLKNHDIYLIVLNDQLVGEMNFMIDPDHLHKKETGTAWIGITIGEPEARGKGVGYDAIRFLEEQIKKKGLKRIELGVFEFNNQAQNLYRKLGYKEIVRTDDFTYWQGKMWADIRMEKYL